MEFQLIQKTPIDLQSRPASLRGTAPLFFGYLVAALYLSMLFMAGNAAYYLYAKNEAVRQADIMQDKSKDWAKETKNLEADLVKAESIKTVYEEQQKWLRTVYPSNEIYRRLFAAVPGDKTAFTITALELRTSDVQPAEQNTMRFDLTIQFQIAGEETASLSRFLQNCNRARLALENMKPQPMANGITQLTASILVELPLQPEAQQ